MLTQLDLQITSLGEPAHDSPLTTIGRGSRRFVPDGVLIRHAIEFEAGAEDGPPVGFEKSGPRERLFFDPAQTTAAVVTCGGLCPGLNNVIRNLYYTLKINYGAHRVLGVLNGYQGLNPDEGRDPIELTDEWVETIHHLGGTALGSSRGPQEPGVVVDRLEELGVNMLFTIGGDGTQRGAHAIAQEALRRGKKIAVVGVPKTIDNDIKYCYQTFGFMSAVAEAERVIDRAHIEAKSVDRGVGLVKLMGREAGFITAAATIASGEVNFALIPEQPFELDGSKGLLPALERRLDARGHALVVVAEGAGQHLLTQHEHQADASCNRKLGDIGLFLKEQIVSYFGREGRGPASVKYFDPSYYIRSAPANAGDSLLCERFARHAAHAAMAGKTDLFIGLWHNHTVHVPLGATAGQHKQMDTERDLWAAVLATTGQEKWFAG